MTVISFLAIGAGMFYFKRQISHSLGAEKDTLVEKITEVGKVLDYLSGFVDIYTSKAQLDTAETNLVTMQADLDKARDQLKQAETKLEVAQKNVDQKEAAQQELKSAKEDEQSKLDNLAAQYEQVSSESVELEKKLANSLKHLDAIMSELQMTQAQRDIMQALSNALTTAGSRLRDVIGEYQTINARLESLKQQHLDLESEYTKLVEQQLGG